MDPLCVHSPHMMTETVSKGVGITATESWFIAVAPMITYRTGGFTVPYHWLVITHTSYDIKNVPHPHTQTHESSSQLSRS